MDQKDNWNGGPPTPPGGGRVNYETAGMALERSMGMPEKAGRGHGNSIQKELDDLIDTTQRLHATIQSLEERVSPVLLPEAPQAVEQTHPDGGDMCSIAARVRGAREELDRSIRYIGYLLSRVNI